MGEKLYIDQWGNVFRARTVKELRRQIPGRCQSMFSDGEGGRLFHVGYVIGRHWLKAYAEHAKAVS